MDDISIVLCGEAGKGIQTVEKLFTKIQKKQSNLKIINHQ